MNRVFLAILLAGIAAGNASAQSKYRESGSQRRAVEGTGNTRNSGGNSGNTGYQSSPAEQAREQRLVEASTANDQGIAFWNKGDWANAVTYFQEAVKQNPGSAVMRDNLAKAQANLQTQQAEAEDKAAAANMQQAINTFAQTLNAAPAASGGLDFDGRNSGNPPRGGDNGGGLDFISPLPTAGAAKPAAALEFGDPKVVNAQNVPSGLSKAVDNAIASAYSDAPPGVSDRVRKGFQAVADRDWKVARAWFEDALNRDPGNANLKHLVAIVDETPKGKKPATSPSPDSAPASQTLTSLNANASKMSTEQIMKALDDIMMADILKETLRETK